MSLQRFKLNIANSVVSSDNTSMNTMSTHQLLDLFSLQSYVNNVVEKYCISTKIFRKSNEEAKSKKKDSSLVNIVDELGELWEEEEYELEYKVNQFLEKLK